MKFYKNEKGEHFLRIITPIEKGIDIIETRSFIDKTGNDSFRSGIVLDSNIGIRYEYRCEHPEFLDINLEKSNSDDAKYINDCMCRTCDFNKVFVKSLNKAGLNDSYKNCPMFNRYCKYVLAKNIGINKGELVPVGLTLCDSKDRYKQNIINDLYNAKVLYDSRVEKDFISCLKEIQIFDIELSDEEIVCKYNLTDEFISDPSTISEFIKSYKLL